MENLEKPQSCPITKLGIKLHLQAAKSYDPIESIDWKSFDFNIVIKDIEKACDNYEEYSDLDHILIWSLAKTIDELLTFFM